MAPEVVRQSGHNRYADIWSLGCTVYELYMRKPPWSEYKDLSVLLKIEKAKGPPKLP
jgi:serine/threonine protein kinase